MPDFNVALVPILVIGIVICLVSIPAVASVVQRRRDRRRILAEGRTAEGRITLIGAAVRSGSCRVLFTFQNGGRQVQCEQWSTPAAVQLLGLEEGSAVRVCFLPKWPRYGFINALMVAERNTAFKSSAGGMVASPARAASTYVISFVDPSTGLTPKNAFRWCGDGDITLSDESVHITAQIARPFWLPKRVEVQLPLTSFANVEVFESAIRCEVSRTSGKPRLLQFWAVSPAEANEIGAHLPDAKSFNFAPRLPDQATFRARLLEVSPRAPATPAIVAANVAMFVVAAALGGGIFLPNAEILILLGSDYTPLTATGEWWRLLSSTFLHFGFLHLAFNMWALWVNGIVAERLFGSSRYLLIYLVAGVAGSLTSFLWHPFVNGAGASGAIFGVLGALLAYFLRTDTGIPRSVIVAQRNAAAFFIVVSILNAARFPGIDNAAHLGGLAAGFILGLLLCRPLDKKRNAEHSIGQWVRALALALGSVLLVAYLLRSGQLHPRVIRDSSGRQILPAELLPPPRTFGGVTLGMTTDQLVAVKGKPIRERPDAWTYDSVDASRDGLLEVLFTNGSEGAPAIVWGVMFWGTRDGEPPELFDLLPLTRDGLEARYGRPTSERRVGPTSTYLYFANGIMVYLISERVAAYGVYDPAS